MVHHAHHFERMLHDRNPRWIHAVETTYDQAETAISGEPPAQPGGGDVVVIEIKGKLVDDFDSEDSFDRKAHKGRYFALVLDRATCADRIRMIGPKGVRLRPLGHVTTVK